MTDEAVGEFMTAYGLNSSNVVQDTIDGEVLAIRSDTGTYYSMTGAAATTWVALLNQSSTAAIAEAVAAHHATDAASVMHDVEAFAATLLDEHLLVAVDTEAAPITPTTPLPAETANTPWASPTFEKYTDMQDLLLFDPIHEVQPSGWPNTTNTAV